MDHLECVGKTHAITAAVFDYDGASRFIGIVPRPVTLKLEQNLNPTRKPSSRLFQPAQGKIMTDRGKPSTGIANDEYLKPVLDGGRSGKRDTSLREQASHKQSFADSDLHCFAGSIVFPGIHVPPFDHF